MASEKHLARAYLADIGSFKNIISSANSYNEIISWLDELRGLGNRFPLISGVETVLGLEEGNKRGVDFIFVVFILHNFLLLKEIEWSLPQI